MVNNKADNTNIHRAYRALEIIKVGTVRQIAAVSKMTESQTTGAVEQLMKNNKAHISYWDHSETSRCPVRVIKLGRGLNAKRTRVDFDGPDNSLAEEARKMREHKRFMANFKPQPDVAAQWLFNEPKVELLGAKYD
jgi:hypothetical protein